MNPVPDPAPRIRIPTDRAQDPNEIEAQLVSGLAAGRKLFFSPEAAISLGEMPALVSSARDLTTFNGAHFAEPGILRDDVIGEPPRIHSPGQVHLIQSEKGVLFQSDDLKICPTENSPIGEPAPIPDQH